jgi:hypothetical protein
MDAPLPQLPIRALLLGRGRHPLARCRQPAYLWAVPIVRAKRLVPGAQKGLSSVTITNFCLL